MLIKRITISIAWVALLLIYFPAGAQQINGICQVLAFYTARNDAAHISFVNEALQWFADMGTRHHFSFESTRDWSRMNDSTLQHCQLLVFLDTRPDSTNQRQAFEKYMKNGGGWIGFHFAGFALTPSDFPQNWNWYHEEFLGAGQYLSNTWRPTSAVLKVEIRDHPVTRNLPSSFASRPNEWYRWKNDLQRNPDIRILLSIDSTSFPVGTGPKPSEIWHEGYYPVVWTNRRYRMIYFNMGHNDIDYEHPDHRTLSHSFGDPAQDQLILNAVLWLCRQE